ncbi:MULTISPECIES: hypothetical protein [Streptomyces]|uniref:hypothetical protein n=1 Tax=Streptomyces lycopersici TaxID=2974589 RepID=UPI0021D2E796|nr:hypothetical protein [Streptomyces sp. NEAU-383]
MNTVRGSAAEPSPTSPDGASLAVCGFGLSDVFDPPNAAALKKALYGLLADLK